MSVICTANKLPVNILLLGDATSHLKDYFKVNGYHFRRIDGKVPPDNSLWDWMDYAVSFGYREILPPQITERMKGKIFNIHISYLPWNRGADPNLWSFLEDTPKGVTIHLIDENLDTGPILVQERVNMLPEDTLLTSYQRLIDSGVKLLESSWEDIISGRVKPIPQGAGGTFHLSKDKAPFMSKMTKGWHTPVKDVELLLVKADK